MNRFILTPLVVLALSWQAIAAPQLGGSTSPDGKTKVQIDVPFAMRAENVGGRDGAGLCVFTSIMHAARWQNELPLEDFQLLMTKERGGGWPDKVDKMIAKYAPTVDYFQYEGIDLAIVRAVLVSGRLPSVTYSGRDPHYKGWIAHMVNIVHLDDQWAAVLDNNYIGENDIVWMTPKEFEERWRGKGSGWLVVLLKEPPEKRDDKQDDHKQPSVGGGNLEPAKYTWHYHNGDPWRIYLYYGEKATEDSLVGAYDIKQNYFRYYNSIFDREKGGDLWLQKTNPPFAPPLVKIGQKSGVVGHAEDYGMPLHMFPPRQKGEERWTRNGKETSRDEILKLLEPKPKPTPSPLPWPAGPDDWVSGPALLTLIMAIAAGIFLKENNK